MPNTKTIANEENKGIEIKEEKRGNYQPSIKRENKMRKKNCVECNEPLFGHHKAPEDSKLCDKCYEEIEGE